MNNVEIIRRRNKQSNPCIEDQHHDLLMLHDKVMKLGCRAPYHTSIRNAMPICPNKEKMKLAHPSLTDNHHNKYYSLPCQTMSNIDFSFVEQEDSDVQRAGSFEVLLSPTDNYKMIEQSKAIDMQALIGNIGGYIGLLLGK